MTELKKSLSLLEATMYGVGVIVGVGIFTLIGRACGMAGNMVWASFVLGAAVAFLTGLSYAELSSIYPKASADYYYVSRAFKNRLLAFLVSWILIFAQLMGTSTVALGFGSYLQRITGTSPALNAFLLILVVGLVNFRGIKTTVDFNTVCILATIAGLLSIIVLGIRYIGSVNYFESSQGLQGVFNASTLLFFAFLGFENIASIAEETKKPQKNIPRAILLSIALTTVLYVLLAVSIVSIASWQELSTSDAPLATALSKVSGTAEILITVLALGATASTCLGLMVHVSRIVYGIAADGCFPEFFTLVHPKYRTPWVSIITTTAFACAFLLIGKPATTASLATFAALIAFVMVNLSVLSIRRAKIRGKFRVPSIKNIPLTSVLGFLLCVFLLLQFNLQIVELGIFVLLIGIFYSLVLDRILKWLEVWKNLKRELTRFQKEFLSE